MKCLAVILISSLAAAADAPVLPLVFVKAESSYTAQGGFDRVALSHRDQGIKAMDLLQRGCHGLTVTMTENKAEYMFMANNSDLYSDSSAAHTLG